MVHERCATVGCLITRRACEVIRCEFLNILFTMFPHEMNDTISPRLALERAERANERTGFIGMSGGYMESEGL